MPDIVEVVEKVQKEIETLGANTKKNFEEINRNYEEVKTVLKKQGTLTRSARNTWIN